MTKGCRTILYKIEFRRHFLIEVKCGDIVWNETEDYRKQILCSNCENKEEKEHD